MAWDDIGAGVAGGLDNFLKTLSWQKEYEQQNRLIDEREATRRDQNNARGVDMMLRERKYMDDAEATSFARAEAEGKRKIFDEWYKALPPEMQQVVTAKQHGVTTDAEDWEDPSAKALRVKDAEAKKYLDEELKHTRTLEAERARAKGRLEDDIKLEGVRHGFRVKEKSGLPVEPKDDPALPRGVRDYLSSMLTKHGGDFAAAEAEWNKGFTEQQTKHPRLDPGRARGYLEDVFGYRRHTGSLLDTEGDGVLPRAPGFEMLEAAPEAPVANEGGGGWMERLGLRSRPQASASVPGDPNALREQEAATAHEEELGLIGRRRGNTESLRSGTDPLRELVDGTGRPTAEPIEVQNPPTDDRPLPRSPEADDDQAQQMETQARSLMEQFRREADPARRAALRSQLQRVRERLMQKSTDRPLLRSPEADGDQLDRLGSQVDSLMQQIQRAPNAAQRNALRRELAPVLQAYQKAGGK